MSGRASLSVWVAALALALSVLLLPASAAAHAVGLSRGSYQVAGATLDSEIVLARAEAAALLTSIDPARKGDITAGDLPRLSEALSKAFVARLVVKGDADACPGSFVDARLTEDDGIAIRLRHVCPHAPTRMYLQLAFVSDLSFGHRHQATLSSGASSTELLAHTGDLALEIAVASPTQAPATPSKAHYITSLLALGVRHILTGYDHLVFLLALVLVGGRARVLVATVTAFTIGHSISLALATFGVLLPSPRIIEPAIALSIAFVGVENLYDVRPETRWRVTLPFGLVHGFGFAGALRELELPRAKIPLALGMFNLGVELGQLAVLALVVPIVLLARRNAWFLSRGVRACSAVIVIAGVSLFVARVLGWQG